MMLDLKSNQWADLLHAYGSGANIPALLQDLITSTDRQSAEYKELWDEIWNLLCHQGTVGSASYAAVPHIVDLAAQLPCQECVTYLIFIGHVEVFRLSGPEPEILPFLEEAYFLAHKRAVHLVLSCLAEKWSKAVLQQLLGTLATLKGETQLGAAISWIYHRAKCPVCYTEFPTRGYSFFNENEEVEKGIVELVSTGSEYAMWTASNPLGYVLWIPRKLPIRQLFVHRPGCVQVAPLAFSIDVELETLVCIPDKQRLWEWLSRYDLHLGRSATECELCNNKSE